MGGAYRLVSIDERPVGRLGMRLTLEPGGTARLAYDCGERFANYHVSGSTIGFSEVSPSTGSCPPADLTGAEKALAEQRGRLLHGPQSWSRSRDRLTLSGAHIYVFAAER